MATDGSGGMEGAGRSRGGVSPGSGRLLSLDALRGFDMFWIVLQYIGLACLLGGSAYVALRSAWAVASLCAVLLLGHGLLMEFAPFPDVRLDKESLAAAETRAGSRKPSKVLATATAQVRGLYEEGRCFSNYVDYRFLPGLKINGAYESQPLLGVLGGVAACLLGVLAGLWMRRGDVSDPRKVAGLLATGAICVAIGAALSLQIPVVKKLWSPSFVLVAGGCSAMTLGLFHAVIEVGRMRRWCEPFVWIGMNPIAIYLAHNIVSFPALAARFAGGDAQRFLDTRVAKGSGSLLLAMIELALTFLFVRFLYARKIFIKL